MIRSRKEFSSLMTAARHKVLAHLKKNRVVSAREIARALKMSTPNVRHHLGILVSDGRVESIETRLREGKGRPEKLYSLSQAALGDNLPVLIDALLAESAPVLKMEAIALRILDPAEFADLSVPRRLAILVEKLTKMNYQARWEAGLDGPRVIFGRCPYFQVIEKHPELCEMDTSVLKNAFSRPVQRIDRGEKMTRGSCPYFFKIG